MKHILHDWSNLTSNNFKGQSFNLLLGNGFSRRYSDRFAYDSLFDEFLKSCDSRKVEAFKVLGTNNFEDILDFLSKANALNSCFAGKDASNPLESLLTCI